ncbi:MAG: repeat protein [Nocardia sp.]|nr:repeat protein [Nocardia sp.]
MRLARDEALALLTNSLSARRRRGAKRLRALADPTTAAQVRTALEREVLDERTWETQYQLVMALGMTGGRGDVEQLKRPALQPHSAGVYVALGDAIVRLGREFDNDPAPALWCLQQQDVRLADGALRAVAMLRLSLPDSAIDDVLDYAEAHFLDRNHAYLPYWPAVAAAGWSGPRVRAFLGRCSQDSRQIVADAAKDALNGRYGKYVSVL